MRDELKRLVRSGVAAGCAATGLLRLAERRARSALIILCYHRILPAERKAAYFNPDLAVTPEAFREHCAWLRAQCEVQTLAEAWEAWDTAERRRPLAVITFDDGYGDNHVYAAPILAEFGLPATFFVISGLAGTGELPWYDRLARAAQNVRHTNPQSLARLVVARAKLLSPAQRTALMQELRPDEPVAAVDPLDRIMSWAELAELANAGHEIGSHSRTHALLPQLDDAALALELAGSRCTLEAQLGISVRSFSYPNGDHDERVVRATAAAGYTSAVTMARGSNQPGQDPLQLCRHFAQEERLLGLNRRTSQRLLRLQLTGLADALFVRGQRGRRRRAGSRQL